MIDIVAEGLDHPECVAMSRDGLIYAGGEAGQLYRVDPASGVVSELGTSGGWLLGLAVDAGDRVFACDVKLGAVLVFETDGSHRVFSTGTPDRPMVTPNFPVFDGEGSLYVSDSGVWPEGGGCIYRIARDGTTTVWTTAASRFANGLAIDPAGRFLYVAESTLPGITRVPILADGSAGEPELVVEMPGTVPDGIAFDRDGRLYIGCYRPDRIYRLDPDGQLVIVRDDFQGTDLAAPTNIAFGGDGRDLYVASLGR
jgi:gluconolactonase